MDIMSGLSQIAQVNISHSESLSLNCSAQLSSENTLIPLLSVSFGFFRKTGSTRQNQSVLN